ncbi:MAG: glucosaminidase domain-containing protein [Hyphomicrobiaceae bacterium]
MTTFGRALPFLILLVAGTGQAVADPGIRLDDGNQIPACTTPERLMEFLRVRNPALERRYDQIAGHYMREGQAMGVRWDYAFFQMIVETGGLTYRRSDGRPGTVGPGQNNFAGLGTISGRDPGETFPDVATGVRAHLQHITLYTGARVANPIAERTRKVRDWGMVRVWQRTLGRPTTFSDLASQWAPENRGYGGHIEAVAGRFREQFCAAPVAPAETPVADAARRSPAPVALAEAPAEARGYAMARQALERAPDIRATPRSGLGAGKVEPPPAIAAEPPPQRYAAMTAPGQRPIVPTAPAAVPTAPVAPAALEPAPAKPLTREDRENEKLRQLVSGRTVHLDTPIGTVIPIEFAEDGRMRGKAGGLAGFLGAAQDEGQWWIEKTKLCQRWNVWFKREQQCLKFKQQGQIINWVSDNGRSGTAKLVGQ